jgi:hypothetical protein
VDDAGTATLIREYDPRPRPRSEWPRREPQDEGLPDHDTRRRLRSRIFSEGFVVFLLAFALFFVVALVLGLRYHAISADAFSRMANGFYILFSRDRHLAAVGFVWTPLQSLADLIFLTGNYLWPALSHDDMAGCLVSALAMAGAVYQIRSALLEWGVTRTPRLVLTAFFALNPMIIFYGGNGMSEGLFLFTLIASTRYLLRWMLRKDLRSLAYAAVALGFSYLTRNEAAGAALLGALAVGAVTFGRTAGARLSRIKAAASDLVIFAAPAVTAAAGWAITSYIITGHFFEQFSSIYGNSEQELFLHHKTFSGRFVFEVRAVEALAPLLPIIVVAAVIVALRKKDPRVLAPIAVLGGALGFDLLAYLHNSIENFFRYFIATVPLAVLLVGSLVAALQSSDSEARADKPVRVGSRPSAVGVLGVLAAVGLVLVTMIPAGVSTASAMFNQNIGSEEVQELGFIFLKHPNKAELAWKGRYPAVVALGDDLAGRHLPNGDIVIDNSTQCVPEMLVTVRQPRLFVIPNDRDFQRVLADPISFNVHYILEPDPASTPITAPNLLYPSLWSTGAEFTKMVHQIPARGSCPEFRLFHVLRHSKTV